MIIVNFPDNRFASARFTLDRPMAFNFTRGGGTQSLEYGVARWNGTFTTTRIPGVTIANRKRANAWKAWWDSLRGGNRGFLGYDPEQQNPVEYPAGVTGLTRAAGGAFDGTASVTSMADPFTLTISTLPIGFQLRAGDYVGLIQSGRYSLHRITTDAAANGSGIVTLAVEPGINSTLFTSGAVANFVRASCVMIPIPGSWSYDPEATGSSAVSFQGRQVFY